MSERKFRDIKSQIEPFNTPSSCPFDPESLSDEQKVIFDNITHNPTLTYLEQEFIFQTITKGVTPVGFRIADWKRGALSGIAHELELLFLPPMTTEASKDNSLEARAMKLDMKIRLLNEPVNVHEFSVSFSGRSIRQFTRKFSPKEI